MSKELSNRINPKNIPKRFALTLATAAAVGLVACSGVKAENVTINAPAASTPSSAAGTPRPEEKPTVVTTLTASPEEAKLGEVVAHPIIVPSNLSEIEVTSLNDTFPEGQWVHPVYNPLEANAAYNWRGIGPHYPIAFRNIEPNAAHITSHGNVGEVVVVSDKGGKIEIAFMQINAHQKDGAWGKDQNGNPTKGSWKMQYNIHALQPNQEVWIVDPDTGKQMPWPDGSPVTYKANGLGIAAFEVPETLSNDVRFGLVFNMPVTADDIQAHEVIIQRGPNDHPELNGVNPLPRNAIKPLVPGDGN